MRKFSYLLTLTFVFILPTLASYYFLRDHIDLQALFPFIVLVTVIGSIWDVWATRHGKRDRVWLWQFNRKQTIGARFLGLPIEEYLFYVASSVYVIFMWEGLQLMVAGAESYVYFTIGGLAGWTLISIAFPYLFHKRGERFIG